jgi:metal-sulfur cluster biosynthetic enzyme
MQQREQLFMKLALVNDPELDRSLTELGFINEVNIQDSSVTVSFRLPTYWCSTNFAFIMAEDIRDRVSELPWVSNVVVRLEDHCAATEINDGVSSGKSFFETFPNMAKGELQGLRETFRIKSYLTRQEKLLQYLIRSGLAHAAILNMTLRDLSDLLLFESEGIVLAERYLAIREEFGQSNQPDQTAFIQPDGKELELASFPAYLASARLTRLSMEFNGHHCQGLFQTRYSTEPLSEMEECKNESSTLV